MPAPYRRVGLLRRHASRGRETVTFEYAPEWLAADDRFSMDPALPVGPGLFRPPAGAEMFGTLGDSAPDTWGRMLMRRRERHAAEREGRAVRPLHETDFLLGVSDLTRLFAGGRPPQGVRGRSARPAGDRQIP